MQKQAARWNKTLFSSGLREVIYSWRLNQISWFYGAALQGFLESFFFLMENKQTEKVQNSYVSALFEFGVFVKRELSVSLELVDVRVEQFLKLLGPFLFFHEEVLRS